MGIPSLNSSGCVGKLVKIYALFDPRDNTIFYVGATTKQLNNRLNSHINDSTHLNMRGPRYDVIRSIHASGVRTQIEELETVAAKEWVEAEQFWIGYLRFIGADLTNLSIGGPGGYGCRQSAVSNRLRSIAAKDRDMSRTQTPEAREKAAFKMRHEIEVEGIKYRGIAAAARALGVSYSTLHYRLDVGEGATRITPRKNDNARKSSGIKLFAETHPYRRAVIIDGVEYWGLTGASRILGVSLSCIQNWLRNGKAKYADGKPPRTLGAPFSSKACRCSTIDAV